MPMVSSTDFDLDVRDIVASFPVRALQLYGPTEKNIEDFERFVNEVAAPVGITHITVCLYYKFEYKRHPEIREAPYTTYSVAKRVAAVCKKNGIKVVPEIDIPAHQSNGLCHGVMGSDFGMLRAYPDMLEPYGEGHSTRSVCTRHPLLRPIVCDMIDELMEAFETDTIHAGFDEALDIGKCPRCKGVPEYVLLAQLVNDIHKHIASKGGEMWMWSDRLLDGYRFPTRNVGYETSLNNTAKAVDLISKDIVITDWHYNEEKMGHLTPSYWAMKGFRFISSAFNSVVGCEQLARATYAVAEAPNTLGMYLTTWSSVSDFIKYVEERMPEYQKTGKIEQDPSKEVSDSENAGNFADYSSNIFLKMFVRHE